MNATAIAMIDDEELTEMIQDQYAESDTSKPIVLNAQVILLDGKISVLFKLNPLIPAQAHAQNREEI